MSPADNYSNWSADFPSKKGKCRICKKDAITEWHHIITRAKAERIGRPDLNSNFGNIVELCVPCHNLTTSSGLKRRYDAEKNYTCASCNKVGHFTNDCPDRIKERFDNQPPVLFFWIRNVILRKCKICGRKWHHKDCTFNTYYDGSPIFIPDREVVSIPKWFVDARTILIISLLFVLFLVSK